MPIINVLDKQTANLIAAGEVVDRPASVVKELLENSIDAGADSITVEIKNGGSTLIRITDNGKGMEPEDVRLSVLRHATSKISNPSDLDGIKTLGFRGEALAAISSVSRFQIISKTHSNEFGTCMVMEGEKEISFDEVGCPDGTTITVRDIFFNVPARRKFLKKDQTETAYISQYIERIAISNPQISFKFISDSKTRFSTVGNGDLKSAIYSVFGKEFSESLIHVDKTHEKIRVHGFISLPEHSRVNRSFQIFFVNGRFVRTRSTAFALEDAYKTYIFNERYPACVLFVELDPYLVDVNVHPSKLEVRFVDEAMVRQAVYFTVRDAIEAIKNPISADIDTSVIEKKQTELLHFTPERVDVKKEQVEFKPIVTEKNTQTSSAVSGASFSFASATPVKPPVFKNETEPSESNKVLSFADSGKDEKIADSKNSDDSVLSSFSVTIADTVTSQREEVVTQVVSDKKELDLKYCGNVFDTYIIAEYDSNMYIIDKHAAHERILYEELKKKKSEGGIQMLIDSIIVSLSSEEFDVAISSLDELSEIGFDYSEFGVRTIAIRGIPTEFSDLSTTTVEEIFVGMLTDIIAGKRAKDTRDSFFDKALFTAACRAAVKGGIPDSEASYRYLLRKISELENVFCCPHGRPIIVKYTKTQIEKMFLRT